MQYRIHDIEAASKDRIEEYVRQRAGVIEERLGSFQEELVTLDVRMRHREKRYPERRDASMFEGHLVLYLPGHRLQNLGATGYGEHWRTALNEAFDDLEDQLQKTLAQLHRETAVHEYQHRPSWEREGAEQLGKPQYSASNVGDADWMEEWDEREQNSSSTGTE